MKNNHFVGATGFAAQYLPPGAETETVMRTLRLGVKFDRQQGCKRGNFFNHVVLLVGQIAQTQKPTFERLLEKMELEVLRHDENSPVVRVSRSYRHVTYRDPGKGDQEISLRALRNVLTAAKKQYSCVPKR